MKFSVFTIISITVLIWGVYKWESHKKAETFHLCQRGVDLHTYLFKNSRIDDQSVFDVLMTAMNGDSVAIVKFVIGDIKSSITKERYEDLDGFEKQELKLFADEYQAALHLLIDKMGSRKIVRIFKRFPYRDRLRLIMQIRRTDKFDITSNYSKKYRNVIDSLSFSD